MQKEGLTVETSDYINCLLQCFEEKGGLPADAILPPIPVPRDDPGPPKPEKFLVPSVILWDPLSQVPNIAELSCPHEIHEYEVCVLRAHTSSKTNYGRWKAARGTQDVPRVLYCCEGSTLLVSRMYTCKKGHKIISHDPRVIEHIPSSYEVPFFLLHRTGFTRELANWVHSCVFAGMTFHEIEEVLIQRHRDAYEDRKHKYNAEVKVYLEKNPDADPAEIEEFPGFKTSQVPSLETIMSSIVHMFEGNEKFYMQRMSEWSAKYIIAGYYFKVATTIGEKMDNGKWTTHYKNIYTVMNEKGQVIAWKFTKEKDLNEVNDILVGLQMRFQQQGKQLEMILVPECCESRDQFQAIFGSDVPVKLELTKAIHRVIRKVPAKKREGNQLTKASVRDFALCLRYPTDRGDTRQESTPPPDVIIENLDAYVSGWKEIIEGTERVLTLAAQRQIVQLRSHIQSGCLSEIPVCAGRETIDDLQNILKPVLERKFLNADMALALISTLLYVWNERKANQLPIGALVRPIAKYRGSLEVSAFVPTPERFGIVKTEDDEGDDLLSSASYSFDVLALQCLILDAFDDKAANVEAKGSESRLSQAALKKVIARASNLMSVWELLKTQAVNEVSINPRLLHLMACSLILFSRNECAIDDRSNHEARLDEMLHYYQLMLLPEKKENSSEADGFFTAVSSGLNSILRSDLPEIESVKQHLASIGYHTGEENSLEDNVSVLRQLISNEWLASEEEYGKLLVSHMISFREEAQAFQKTGYFKAEMSNLLPIAAAKVLRVPVVVFTSLQHFPIVPVVPSDAIIIGSCVHVAYNAAGFGGFYDVGTYVSNTVVLPKIMTDPLVRRRDSRKRYREKMALLKVNEPAKKRGKKSKATSTREDVQTTIKTEEGDESAVSQKDESLLDSSSGDITVQDASLLDSSSADITEQDASLLDSSSADITEQDASLLDSSSADITKQDASLDVPVEEGETSLDKPIVPTDAEEGVEAATNLIEMAYGEAGMTESTMEEAVTKSPLKIAIIPGSEPEVSENQTTLQTSETELITAPEGTASEDVSTIGEDVINQSVDGQENEFQMVGAEGETETQESVSVSKPFTPGGKSGLLDTESVITFQEGLNANKPTYSCSCGRGSGKNQKRTQFCLTLEGGYLTRCACYRNASGCSHRCRCYLCCNPYGTAEAAKATKPARQVRRFRPRHKVQAIKSRLAGIGFSTPLKAEVESSKWVEVDNLAFECLIAVMSHAGLELTPEKIAAEYDCLCKLSKDEGGILGNILQPKALADITQQLEVVQKNIRTFENLYKKQTELNWFQGMEVVFSTEVVVSS